MKNFAEFAIIGNVGSVKKLTGATRISIASNYRRKAEDGVWTDDTHWNHVVVFSEAVWKLVCRGFRLALGYDSSSGYGPSRAVAGWPRSHARPSATRLT